LLSPDSLNWFAIWTRSRHEQVVREQLAVKQIDVFLPTITRWSRWKDRKKKVDWPLFPGYCFARFDPADTLPILKCTGVVNIISFEGKPAPIPDYELDSIRLLIDSELQYDPCPLIREGMMGTSSERQRVKAAGAWWNSSCPPAGTSNWPAKVCRTSRRM
jgi:transcription antitermination factor NusG